MIFKNIGIVGKAAQNALGTIEQLIQYLQKKQLGVFLEEKTASHLAVHSLLSYPLDELCQNSDLLIVVGGDGTLLASARTAVLQDTPILGINLGRLGFLVDISPAEMFGSLDQIFAGQYEVDDRSLLQANMENEQNMYLAFNDVVIHKWNTARLIEFETFINGQYVENQRSDGLIISTPTGSTAYALSGGGPLIHPALDAFALVPICPHTLSNRPIVVDASSNIEIKVCGHTPMDQIRVTCDGQDSLPLSRSEQSIFIKRYEKSVRLIHPPGHDHYHILRTKLGWGKHHTN